MYQAIVFLPLLGAIVAGLFGRVIGVRGAQIVTVLPMLVSAGLSVLGFWNLIHAEHHEALIVPVADWIRSGAFEVDWTLRIDTLTSVMLVVVTVVSALVHVYSVGYMSHDPHPQRFMAYLSLFTFAMLMLVTADNFLQMFFGWEGVGLASYLLIGFWYKRPSANAAAIKAFVVNRVGDFGFALGIMGVFVAFGSVDFATVFAGAPGQVGKTFHFLGADVDVLTTICLLLFVGAMGKSAQIGLHTWLPDAMEGPTPVSALIHAATMVTAGVFMVARCSPLFSLSPAALDVVAIVGATTAIFAATVGLVQNDIKRVIAYSTCSQLGYMFFALGVGGYGAAVFHLFTHAFFKALLFLGAGSVIHAMSDEQDMRNMGGIWRKIPFTYAMMWIGSLALAGVPFFAGFYSKDIIVEAAFARGEGVGQYAFAMGVLAALLTAFYSWRLIFMTFHGKPRADHHVMEHVHESPLVMTLPLAVLALGAIFAGYLFAPYFVGHERAEFWGQALVLPPTDILQAAHHIPSWVALVPTVMGVVGIALAWLFYVARPGIPKALAETNEPLYKFLLNKWYFDELYHFALVRPALWFGRIFWKQGDGRIIDGLGPDGIAALTRGLAARAGRLQSGYVYHYAFAMLIGVAALVSFFIYRIGPTH